MSHDFVRFQIGEGANIEVEGGEITPEEKDWLQRNGVFKIRGFQTETGVVNTAVLDVEKLSQIAFEFDLLKQVASSVETDILETFRKSEDRTLTTGEISEATGRPKSSVSRALSRLTEKQKVTKVQAGVYRYGSGTL